MLLAWIDRLGDYNPQLFREIKGRFKPRNFYLVVGISLVAQFLTYLYYRSQLPISPQALENTKNIFNRYCLGSVPKGSESQAYWPYTSDNYCIEDLLGNWTINWSLWWLDVFAGISVIGIFTLLVIGTYMLIADLSKEESQGTLNFVRLSPRSASSILFGKVLGVPLLIYAGIALALPLHFTAGLLAGVPLHLILGFDAVVIASCAFFYSSSLILGLINGGFVGFRPWLGSGIVLFFLLVSTSSVINGYWLSHTAFDWIVLYHPMVIFPYLVRGTFLASKTVGYFNIDNLNELKFYGHSLWQSSTIGMSFVIFNFSLWTFWAWQGIKRRFDNPLSTLLGKKQSYFLTLSYVALSLGFTLQTLESHNLFNNFWIFQGFLVALYLTLIGILSPERQTLLDWARFRHQLKKAERKSLWKDLLFGDKSPGSAAIALCLLLTTAYSVPSLLLFPLEGKISAIFWGLVLCANILLIYALIAQMLLMMKTSKRILWATGTISALMIVPLICYGLFNIQPTTSPVMWFLTFIPIAATQYANNVVVLFSFLGQWIAIGLLSFQMQRQLQKAGESATKALMASRVSS
jgi:hypothetical protein